MNIESYTCGQNLVAHRAILDLYIKLMVHVQISARTVTLLNSGLSGAIFGLAKKKEKEKESSNLTCIIIQVKEKKSST